MKILHILGASPLYTNTFLLITEAGHGIAIDPAAPVARYTDALKKENAKLTHILLTHGHYDHVGAVKKLKEETGAIVYLDAADRKGDTLFPIQKADAEYSEQKPLQIDELTFRCWHTPGHTGGSWCLFCEGFLFCGDTLFAGSSGRVDLPGGNADAMRQSLSKVANLPISDETQVLPGHGEFSTMGKERKTNPYLLGEWY